MTEKQEQLNFTATKRGENVLTTVTAPDGSTLGIDRLKDVAEIFTRRGVKLCGMRANIAESELSLLPIQVSAWQEWLGDITNRLGGSSRISGSYSAAPGYLPNLCKKGQAK